MRIETKFDIGQAVKFRRVITRGTKRKSEESEIHVGIITKIVVEAGKFHYLTQSSFSGTVPEEWILCALEETATEELGPPTTDKHINLDGATFI